MTLQKLPVTRRDFLARSTSLLGSVAALGIGPRAFAQGSDVIRLGLVGCGGRGTGAAASALSVGGVQLTAIADVFADSIERQLKGLRARGGGSIAVTPQTTLSGLDAYQRILEHVDAVILATPPAFRPQHFAAAVAAGVHCFLEKPLAVDGPGIRQILNTGEQAKLRGLTAMVGFSRRHDPHYKDSVQRLQDGAIGPVHKLEAYWRGGGVWNPRMTWDEKPSALELQVRNWYYFTWLSGDHIVEQHSTNLDVCNWIKGAHPVSAESIRAGRTARIGHKYGDIYDEYVTRFLYADGAELHSHARQQLAPRGYQPDPQEGGWNRVEELVTGELGSATLAKSIENQTGTTIWKPDTSARHNPYQLEQDVFVEAIRSGRPVNDVPWAAESTLTCIMGRMAAHEQRVVTWDDALNAREALVPDDLGWNRPPPTLPDKYGDYLIPARGRIVS